MDHREICILYRGYPIFLIHEIIKDELRWNFFVEVYSCGSGLSNLHSRDTKDQIEENAKQAVDNLIENAKTMLRAKIEEIEEERRG